MATLLIVLGKIKDFGSKIFSLSTASHMGTILLGALIGFFAHGPLKLAMAIALDFMELLRKF